MYEARKFDVSEVTLKVVDALRIFWTKDLSFTEADANSEAVTDSDLDECGLDWIMSIESGLEFKQVRLYPL
ncbi:hypothetical protein QR680_018907 [Steinernema hermaphroditum]|uniref:Uncharacterized protein n=1 Tax=Steinernema hermaphroditum TaxID=289476 RepID=A0AA39HKD6_9BILA|nr:hypothetical protein QR680_018907 [Steinernema hermaphroditum]